MPVDERTGSGGGDPSDEPSSLDAFGFTDGGDDGDDGDDRLSEDPIGARAMIAVGIAVLSAVGAAVLAMLASGSIGPGRLAAVGPQPGAVALAVGLEVLLGAGILLLSPRRRAKDPVDSDRQDAGTGADPDLDAGRSDAETSEPARGFAYPGESSFGFTDEPVTYKAVRLDVPDAGTAEESARSEAVPDGSVPDRPAAASRPRPADDPDSTPTADLGRRRPQPLPPLD
jgi:hypothetical protein